ncbi:hypothetical protein [Halorubellus sp. JP-L1]|uniref:hypothetical protein n=1 Tax=Halorubellus sp. JP-L1 TaxID=2715753 RepID=UPI001877BC85|nr:hypothetical protein [Halorubellus sp. JP-L1]
MPSETPFVDRRDDTLDTDQILLEAVRLAKLVGLFVAIAVVPFVFALLLGPSGIGFVFGVVGQFVLAVGTGIVLMYVIARAIAIATGGTDEHDRRDHRDRHDRGDDHPRRADAANARNDRADRDGREGDSSADDTDEPSPRADDTDEPSPRADETTEQSDDEPTVDGSNPPADRGDDGSGEE